MSQFITQKRPNQSPKMRAELSTTIEERPLFIQKKNITDCNTYLEAFLAKLEKANQATDKTDFTSQKLYKPSASNSLLLITQRKKKMPEFLWGFLYLGYTKELTDFIREAALAYGFKPIPTVIDLYYCRVE